MVELIILSGFATIAGTAIFVALTRRTRDSFDQFWIVVAYLVYVFVIAGLFISLWSRLAG